MFADIAGIATAAGGSRCDESRTTPSIEVNPLQNAVDRGTVVTDPEEEFS